jgi:hypothetical protein
MFDSNLVQTSSFTKPEEVKDLGSFWNRSPPSPHHPTHTTKKKGNRDLSHSFGVPLRNVFVFGPH